ncbi:ABC transporter related [Gloeothece citriformis PCC 7424]|uniref:ABC transporter related n=1 Tax=Gloeothece citriformis (strain PCC 7424) TaxID=65393 RepID=B7KBX1_GLOC7|nr:polysaccharide ABC transporter ATP-binding protein [Gloeothece citriformis]ACK68794.1 ABC transporter related [Gloeothece citriformis PCC 7424]
MMTDSKTEKAKVVRSQNEEVVLSIQGVSKKFCRDLKLSLSYGIRDIATELIGMRQESNKLRKGEFWAIQNVSFELRRGEALGLIGPNGSGKTTLMRIIAGLIKPDTGYIDINGRIAPLIALGAGFNPILTGRENVYANMSILGVSKKDIDARFDDVINFAEIGDAIDAPVKSYSSGMAARLGFASAIHTEPDILLIDEVLAVGDVRFRQKCFRKLHELRQKGTAFILVSHNAQSILNICDHSVYLLYGKLMASGKTDEVMSKYEADLFNNGTQWSRGAMYLPEKPKSESLGLDITYLLFRNAEGDVIEAPVTGEPTNFCIGYKADQEIDDVGIILTLHDIGGEGDLVLILSSINDNKLLKVLPGKHEIQIQMPYLGLKAGLYTMKVLIRKGPLHTFDFVESFRFDVKAEATLGRSKFYQPHEWEVVTKFD